MGLLNPAALYFGALVPLLIVAYLARERPRQVVVSSVLAFRALHVMRGERFGGRPRLSWLFFLEILILCMAVLAMAEPFLMRRGHSVAVVLDNSAPMQARSADGRTRFAAAVAGVTADLANDAGDSAVAVYLTAPTPHQMAAFHSPQAATAALATAMAVDAPSSPSAIAGLVAQLLADRHLARIIVASYRPVTAPLPPRVSTIVAGGPIANYAIGSFALTRGTLGTATLHGRVVVANFSSAEQTLKVAISADNKVVANAQTPIGAGELEPLDFPNLPLAQVYRATLEPDDGFMLDNVAFATAAAERTVSVLFVSPTIADGESLKAIPGIAVATRTPATYSPKDLSNIDLAIFEYTVPKEFPAVNALLVMPPPGDPLFGFAVEPSSQLRLTGWSATDPLTDGVNFRLLNIRSGEYFAQHPWMSALVSGADGGLILAGDRQDHRYLATGFNPFPYLGRQNLPMSILTLNLLSHLAGFGGQSGAFRTGEPWIVPAGVSSVILPSGERATVEPGHLFTGACQQGIYRLVGASGTSLRAVILGDLNASELEHAAPLTFAAPAGAPATEAPPIRAPLASYVLIAIILLIALEALYVYRPRRPIVEA